MAQRFGISRPSLGSVFCCQECPALQIRVVNVLFCPELAAGSAPVQGCAPITPTGLFPALPAQRTHFLPAPERHSLDWCLFLNIYKFVLILQPVITWVARCLMAMCKSCHRNDDLELIFNGFQETLLAVTGDFAG